MDILIVIEDIDEVKVYHVYEASDEQLEISSEAHGQYLNSNADEYSAAMKVWDACSEDNHSGNNPAWDGIWVDKRVHSGVLDKENGGLFICQMGVM